MTLNIVQGQHIEFEVITFSSKTRGLCVGPNPSYTPFRIKLLAYKKDMVSISIFVMPLPPKLGLIIPSLHDPSSIPIVIQRPRIKVMWSPK